MNKKIVLSFDPILKELSENGLQKSQKNSSNKLFIVIPRRNSTREFLNRVQSIVGNTSDEIRILSFQPEDPKERETTVSLARQTGATVFPVSSLDALRGEMTAAKFVLAERYHGALAALALGIPFDVVPQQSGDKLDSLTKTERNKALELVEEGEQALRSALSIVRKQ